jgi:hypothetical protein
MRRIKQIQHKRTHIFNMETPPNRMGKTTNDGQHRLHYFKEFTDGRRLTICSTSLAQPTSYIYKGGNIETN